MGWNIQIPTIFALFYKIAESSIPNGSNKILLKGPKALYTVL